MKGQPHPREAGSSRRLQSLTRQWRETHTPSCRKGPRLCRQPHCPGLGMSGGRLSWTLGPAAPSGKPWVTSPAPSAGGLEWGIVHVFLAWVPPPAGRWSLCFPKAFCPGVRAAMAFPAGGLRNKGCFESRAAQAGQAGHRHHSGSHLASCWGEPTPGPGPPSSGPRDAAGRSWGGASSSHGREVSFTAQFHCLDTKTHSPG